MIDIIRQFFTWVDSIVYGFVGGIYNLIETMTTYRIFDANEDFLTNKIYTLLSIFMLFKVSFSFINYLVNPDSFTDKEKGVQKIVVNIVIMFILLVISPWAFKQMWNLQDALLKEDVIATFIFEDGESSLEDNSFKMWNGCTETSTAATDGDYIALMVLRGFFQPYDEDDIPAVGCNITNATPSSYLTNVKQIVNAPGSGSNEYKIDYKIIVSTAVGVVVLLILISFAMDVGLRIIKLSFLQLIAPIPIVSYIEPSSSKNGMFIKWLKEVGATWASVFIRLFALFFAVRIIQELGKPQLMTIDGTKAEPDFLITVFLIIGALMFAKQLPKLISDITGLKLDGGFSLNPLKKIENEALGGKQLLGAGAATGAAALALGANSWTGARKLVDPNTWKNRKGQVTAGSVLKGLGNTVGSPFAGAASAGYRAFQKTSKDGNVFGGIKNGHLEAMFAKQQREDLERRGSSFGGRLRADANRWVGNLNKAQQNILDFDEEEQKIKIAKEYAQAGLKEYSDIISSMNDKINAQIPVKNVQGEIDALKEKGEYYDMDTGKLKPEAEKLMNHLQEVKAKTYNDIKGSADMIAWQKRLDELVNDEELNLEKKFKDRKTAFNPTGFKSDGTIDVKAIYDAKSIITAVDVEYVQRENELKQRKESYDTKRADADNASRKITGPQPEGWKPSTNVNEGGTKGYGGNQWYNNRGGDA